MTKEERSTQEYETMLHEAMTQDFSDLVSLNLVYESGTFPPPPLLPTTHTTNQK